MDLDFLTCNEGKFSRACRMEPMHVLELIKENIKMAAPEQIGGGHKFVTPCCCHEFLAQKIHLVSATFLG